MFIRCAADSRDDLVLEVLRRERIVPWRNRVLAPNPTIFTHDSQFAAAFVSKHLTRCTLCIPLRGVDAACAVRIIALVHPFAIRALVHGSIVLAHGRFLNLDLFMRVVRSVTLHLGRLAT
jgi:hypothetical protein